MKPRLVLVGLGHGQLEILDCLEELRHHYEVFFIGSTQTIYTGAFPQAITGDVASAVIYLRPDVLPVATRLISIDPFKKVVTTEIGSIEYDKLVLSTGAKSPGVGMSLKPMTDQVVQQIKASSSITIVGGGKAGVELAFACSRLGKKVTLYANRLLPESPKRVQHYINRLLIKSGVIHIAKKYDDESFSGGIVLDATGVAPDPWWYESGLAKEQHFIDTDRYLRHIDFPDIFVTGDMARRLYGGVDAVRSGRHVAAFLLGKEKPFKERKSLNIMITVPGKALLTFHKLNWHGRIPFWLKRKIDVGYMKKHQTR